MIYLMRHSQATPSDYKTCDDARWLTEQGRKVAGQAGQAFAEHLSEFRAIDCIVSSPCVRAVQTAEIVGHALGWRGEIQVIEALRSERAAQQAVEELQALPFEVVLALSHEPIVSMMSQLLADEARGAFRTAEIRGFSDQSHWSWRV